MIQAIAGVSPPEVTEAQLTTVWPSIGAWSPGRLVGRLVGIRLGWGAFTLGKLFALAAIPISLAVYAWRLMPFFARRYTLTSRRVAIQKGLVPVVSRSIELDQFDAIDIEVLPGHGWLRAGDVVFQRDGREVFRLTGVPRPEPFRETCLKAQTALLTVRNVLQGGATP
jgi:hypothetical protein